MRRREVLALAAAGAAWPVTAHAQGATRRVWVLMSYREVDPEGDPFAHVEPGQGRLTVRASLFVERDSQKGIIIGRGGSRLKEVGSQARAGINELVGRKVHLDLRVKVAKDWQRDPKQLGRLGF